MGQQQSAAPSGVDCGPLSDAELEAALASFERLACDGVVPPAAFTGLFDLAPGFGEALHGVACRFSRTKKLDAQGYVDFVAATLRGTKRREAFICAACGADINSTTKLSSLGRSLWAITCEPGEMDATAILESVRRHAADEVTEGIVDAGEIAVSSVIRWATRHCGALGELWARFARPRLLNKQEVLPSILPKLNSTCHVMDGLTTERQNTILCSLALHLERVKISRDWRRLFSSGEDGLSFFRMTHGVVGYGGPTVMLIRTRDGDLFGAFVDTPWKESTEFYGGSDCCLFSLEPRVAVCRAAAGSKRLFMYLNLQGATRVRGIQIGGSGGAGQSGARIYLPEQLGDATMQARGSCLTYEASQLAPRASETTKVEIDTLEVWGVGGDDALSGREKAQKARADYLQQARKVDKAKFLDSEFDKEHLLGKTFGTK